VDGKPLEWDVSMRRNPSFSGRWPVILGVFASVLLLSLFVVRLLALDTTRFQFQGGLVPTPTRVQLMIGAIEMEVIAPTPARPGVQPVLSDSPAQACTYSFHYFRDHPQSWLVENVQIGGLAYSKAEAMAVLEMEGEDVRVRVFQEFMAVLLNILRGADYTAIEGSLDQASQWLGRYRLDLQVPEGEREQGVQLVQALADFNLGMVGPGHCPDEGPTPTPVSTLTETPAETSTMAPTRRILSPTPGATPTPTDEPGSPPAPPPGPIGLLPTATPSASVTATQVATPTPFDQVGTPTPLPPQPTPTLSPLPSATPLPAQPTQTLAPSDPTQPTHTPKPTETPIPTNIATPTSTPTLSPTTSPTETPQPTQTQAPTQTPQPTNPPQPTNTPVPTATPEPVEVKITGIVTAITSTAWIVDGKTFVITSQTDIRDFILVGDLVEVRGIANADGTYTATRIELAEKKEETEFSGVVEVMSGNTWIISGQPVTIVPGFTEIIDDIQVGDPVEVRAQVEANGTLTATRIELDD
jgi:hypothetical protein